MLRSSALRSARGQRSQNSTAIFARAAGIAARRALFFARRSVAAITRAPLVCHRRRVRRFVDAPPQKATCSRRAKKNPTL
jgi:hypothetical protein